MERNNITGLQYEQQKLKVAKAQAQVVKATYGAQRSALDQLMGQMMGTFEKVGGIFGPDSDILNARKVGQGYSKTKDGMYKTAGEDAHDSYKGRILSLNGDLRGKGSTKIFSDGHSTYDTNSFGNTE
jgi:hypothetical protein